MPFKVTFLGKEYFYEKPIKILDIVGDNKEYICAKVNNSIRELTYEIDKDAKLQILTLKNGDSKEIYEASLRYLISMAINNVFPKAKTKFSYTVSRAFFIHFLNHFKIKNHDMITLENEINRLVALDYPLVRKKASKDEVRDIFIKEGFKDKAEIMKYRPEKTAHYYECNGYKNYMYERMVPSLGYLSKFKLIYYPPGIVVQYPRSDCNGEIPEFQDSPRYHKSLDYAHYWASLAELDTVLGVNKAIKKYNEVNVINMCEHSHNYQFAELGNQITLDINDIKLICVAGPSSSGKTTFANRLRVELLSRGLKPIRISIDDYYLPRSKIKKDENGEYDLESIDALDIERFNHDISALIDGEEVELPKFNFKTQTVEVREKLKITDDQPIIIEGIHALNDSLTYSIPRHQKFKVYISPQSQINIDEHNPMSLTYLRLVRRIVRDNLFRNSSAEETLAMWKNVRRGEFKWIYHYIEGADYVFNSFLYYELCVLKKYAMPLLENISRESPYFSLAESLIRMLKFFNDIDDKWIPCNSLLKEFIGGSCYAD